MTHSSNDDVGARWPELLVALFLVLLAGIVIADSLRVGIGWADDGPESGYFPFYIGLALLLSSGSVALRQVRRWAVQNPVFAEREQLRSVGQMLLPMVIYVVAVAFLGLYVASIGLIGYFMRRHGRYGWGLSTAVSLGVPLFFFMVFERWFLVPLHKGPIERLLGF